MWRFCGNPFEQSNSTAVCNTVVARTIRTPGGSENTDPFILQHMMSFHNVDEIRRCLVRVQQISDEVSPAGFSHLMICPVHRLQQWQQHLFHDLLPWFHQLKGSPLNKQQIGALYFQTYPKFVQPWGAGPSFSVFQQIHSVTDSSGKRMSILLVKSTKN